ncbi:hypothetical protein OSTOST_15161 [Ostertagia ostertagi]
MSFSNSNPGPFPNFPIPPPGLAAPPSMGALPPGVRPPSPPRMTGNGAAIRPAPPSRLSPSRPLSAPENAGTSTLIRRASAAFRAPKWDSKRSKAAV